jgi:adenylyl cyclase-associated protein
VYVKEYHTTGVTWNPRGCDVSEYSSDAPPAAAAAAPAAPAQAAAAPSTATAAPAKVNLFAELSKEGEVTKGLKTVTKDMQTWRKEFKGGDAPVPAPAKKAPAPRVQEVVKGTPKVEYQAGGAKWVIEYQSASDGPVNVAIEEKKQSVYIFGCIGANITITGKCKSIILDGCKKTQLTFDTAFASVEIVNSQRVQVMTLPSFIPPSLHLCRSTVLTRFLLLLLTRLMELWSTSLQLPWTPKSLPPSPLK